MQREQMLNELQMLTGVMVEDATYLVYLLTKKDSQTSIEKVEPRKYVEAEPVEVCIPNLSIDEWFNRLEEVQ